MKSRQHLSPLVEEREKNEQHLVGIICPVSNLPATAVKIWNLHLILQGFLLVVLKMPNGHFKTMITITDLKQLQKQNKTPLLPPNKTKKVTHAQRL